MKQLFLVPMLMFAMMAGCQTPQHEKTEVPVAGQPRFESETGVFVTKREGAVKVMSEHCQGPYHVEDDRDSSIEVGVSSDRSAFVRYRCK